MEREAQRADQEHRDVDRDGQAVQARELERRQVARPRGLGPEPRRVGLGEEHLPRVHRPEERHGQHRHDPPPERGPLAGGQRHGAPQREHRRDQPEPVVPGKDALHEPDRQRPVDQPEAGRGEQEREEQLDAQAGAEDRAGQGLEHRHPR